MPLLRSDWRSAPLVCHVSLGRPPVPCTTSMAACVILTLSKCRYLTIDPLWRLAKRNCHQQKPSSHRTPLSQMENTEGRIIHAEHRSPSLVSYN